MKRSNELYSIGKHLRYSDVSDNLWTYEDLWDSSRVPAP